MSIRPLSKLLMGFILPPDFHISIGLLLLENAILGAETSLGGGIGVFTPPNLRTPSCNPLSQNKKLGRPSQEVPYIY